MRGGGIAAATHLELRLRLRDDAHARGGRAVHLASFALPSPFPRGHRVAPPPAALCNKRTQRWPGGERALIAYPPRAWQKISRWGAQGSARSRAAPLAAAGAAAEAAGAAVGPAGVAVLWVVVLGAALVGSASEDTAIGRSLSAPVVAMLVAAAFANLGVLPPPGPYLSVPQVLVVKLATPLLMMGADLRVVAKDAGRLLGGFGFGALGTAAGALAATALLCPQVAALGDVANGDGWKLAGALVAKNVGGGINYIAVATTLGLSAPATAAGIAVDNIFALLYFPAVSWAGDLAEGEEGGAGAAGKEGGGEPAPSSGEGLLSRSHVPRCLLFACAMAGAAELAWPSASLPLATALAVALATAAPRAVGDAAKTGEVLGRRLLFVYFATAGASGGRIAGISPYAALFPWLLVMYGVHAAAAYLGGRRLLGLGMRDVLVASNANIGGPATATALASAKGWDRLVVPAVLAGNFGNAVGSFVGLGVGAGLQLLFG